MIAALGSIRLGYRTPEYAGYEDLLSSHMHRLAPVRIATNVEDGFTLSEHQFAAAIADRGIDACVWRIDLYAAAGN